MLRGGRGSYDAGRSALEGGGRGLEEAAWAAAQTGGALRCSRYCWMSSASRFSQAALRRMFSQHCCTVRSAAGAGWLSKKLCRDRNTKRDVSERV